MNCKHRQIKGETTKYFCCELKEKAVDEYMDCRDCPLKIPDNTMNNQLNELFEKIFGKGFVN